MDILTMADFSQVRKRFSNYVYPTCSEIVLAELQIAHWLPGAMIMTYWVTQDNRYLKSCLFPDRHRHYAIAPEILENVTWATLTIVQSSSGKAYLRNIDVWGGGCA